ncbi:alpha/beta fold hydrolase [Roseiconus lacunae]|uniref:alpha/beta fold hydrolase n=1 Tax=Roseiconus lacunae TaxID=2605694 RepID=UPI0030860E6A|nr:alpha/beta fold hydrolase [Stieleria sp. HD01]
MNTCPCCNVNLAAEADDNASGQAGQGRAGPQNTNPVVHVQSSGTCPKCCFPWQHARQLRQRLLLDAPLDVPRTGTSQRPAIEYQNASQTIAISPVVTPVTVVGREAIEPELNGISSRVIRHRQLQQRHVAISRDIEGRIWFVRLDAQADIFLDGRAAAAGQINLGNVLQLGPLAWRLDHTETYLHPVRAIAGFDLAIDSEVPGRLRRSMLTINRGQMTAVVGPSGCGKSTLLETIRDGSGLVGELDQAEQIYFVPQKDLVHHDLKLGDALESIGQLYGREVLPYEIDEALDAVGLPVEAKHRFPQQLSGGQLRRFRIAGALISGAGVIVLDEPDSGLDHETADEIIRLLRSLAVCGATIVAVTHHRHVLEQFDRVIEMKPSPDGGIVTNQATESTQPRRWSSSSPDAPDAPKDHHQSSQSTWQRARRLAVLIRREQRKLTSPRLGWLGVGHWRLPQLSIAMLLVPMLFAIAVSISVPSDPDRDMTDGLRGEMAPIVRLGFMAVIAVIWMSASASHLSITRDRELIDHEKSHGIGMASLLFAKSVILTVAAALQTIVFAVLLDLIRYRWLDRSYFLDETPTQLLGVMACLVTVSVAATMLGLLISSVAGRNPLVATAILPVVMVIQILFSAAFAVSDPDGYEPLADYQRLQLIDASDAPADESDATDDFDDSFAWEDDVDAKPLRATTLISYATLSRYGDIWLRSFAVTEETPENASEIQFQSLATLLGISAGCFVFAWGVLKLQATRLGKIRSVVHKRSPTGVITSLMVAASFGGAFSSGAGHQLAHAQEGSPAPDVIRIEISDGRYDENAVLRAFGGRADGPPKMRALDGQDRLGLVALELVGKIRFTLTDKLLQIERLETPKWELMRHLAPPRLVGKDDARGRRDVIVFVHGLEGGASTFAAAQNELDRRDLAWLRFEYPNDGPPDEIGRMLAQQLADFKRESPRSRLHLVAHSLGGLVSLAAVTEDPAEPIVDNVFTLGTPFGGSALASFHDELELFDVFFRIATVTPGAFNTIADGRGEAARALKPDSEFLRELLARPRPTTTRFHVAAGTKSFLSDDRRERLIESVPAELRRLRIDPRYAARIEALLESDELDDGMGDGAVTIESASKLPDPDNRVRFPLTHTGLVSDLSALRWVLQTAGLDEP